MKNTKPELEHIRKTIRLTGIMASLAKRQREAIEEQMSYIDFLTLMMSDEVARRDQNKFDSRIRRAGFRGEKTIENFDFTFDPRIDKQLIVELSTCQFIEEKVSTLIVGPCGSGKSHIAQALYVKAMMFYLERKASYLPAYTQPERPTLTIVVLKH